MKPKLCFIIWALEAGGGEKQLVHLVKNIPREKYSVIVVCLTRKGVWSEEVEENEIRVISFNKRVGFDPLILPRLYAFLVREKPDLVNTYLWTADLWGRLAAILAGVRCIVVTEENVDVWKKWYHKIIDYFLFKWTDLVICVSHEVYKFYNEVCRVPSNKLKVIPNAVDLAPFDSIRKNKGIRKELGLSPSDFVFVCVARFHPQKAHDVLIEAVYKLSRESNCNFKLLLIGKGELRSKIEKQVREFNLADRIFFLGWRDDLPEILVECDAFVLSSDYEGLPLTILEAMAAQLPIISTDVGGNAQVVINGENGFLVPPRDPSALAKMMKKIQKNRKLAKRMGAKGRAMVENEYTIQKVTQRTLKEFEKCLSKNS